MKYIGKSHYNFTVPEDIVTKEVHWYLMTADNYHSRPQREEFFVDSGYYKFHEIYHLLRFSNEKQIVEKAYQEYLEMRSQDSGENSTEYKLCRKCIHNRAAYPTQSCLNSKKKGNII